MSIILLRKLLRPTNLPPCTSSNVYTNWAIAWEKAAGGTKAMKAARRAAANPETTKDELTKGRRAALENEAGKRPPAAKVAAVKAANLAASLTEAEAAKAAPKTAAADKAADKATRGAISNFYKGQELRCRCSWYFIVAFVLHFVAFVCHCFGSLLVQIC